MIDKSNRTKRSEKNNNREKEKKQDATEVLVGFMRPAAGPIYDLLDSYGKADIFGSRETFARLNPGVEPEKAARENGIRIIAYALWILIVTIVLTFLCVITQEDQLASGKGLKRGKTGEGAREYELEVSSGQDAVPQNITVTVNEQKVPDDELDSYFERAYEALIRAVLAGNASAGEVRENLNLITQIPGTPVRVKFDDPDPKFIFADGTIRFDNITEPVIVTLSAELTYFDEVRYYSFPVRIVPKEDKKESFTESLERLLDEQDRLTREDEYYTLPDKLDGTPLFWASHSGRTAGVVAAGGLIAMFAMIPAMAADTKKKYKEREIQMNRDYGDIISKLSLLLTAGMTCRGAWEKIVSDYLAQKGKGSRFAYEEMSRAVSQLRLGRPESMVYEEFGIRCGVNTFQRLGSLLAKNLKRGSREITGLLESEARDAFEERRQNVRQRGEEVGTKLLFPMFGMFGIVIAIVVVPAFSSMGL